MRAFEISASDPIRSLEFTPTWSVATVLTILVVISLVVERSIHHLGHWLQKTKRRPLYEALEKMKEELMLLGFISLLLTATSNAISGICIKTSHYESILSPCKVSPVQGRIGHKLLQYSFLEGSARHSLTASKTKTKCRPGYEPFVPFEGLEQLHRFIFVLAVTHVFYSGLTMLLALIKVYGWKIWEVEAHHDSHESIIEITRKIALKRQSTFVMYHTSGAWSSNRLLVWLVCFFRQFGQSVVKADYLTLRLGFISNHNLANKFDFHNYMTHSMEDDFKEIVGISGVLWGFVVAFMLFNINGSNLYFWIAFIPVFMILLVGAKLQHIIATLALENAGLTGPTATINVKPRDDLFWFSKPEFLLSLIHFILFQWQFGYNSCFLNKVTLVYIRLFLGFASQILCSYSTLPLYSLVTQMGTNYKVALIPLKVRESIHSWKKAAKRNQRYGGRMGTCNGGGSPSVKSEGDGMEKNGVEKETYPPSSLEVEMNPQPQPPIIICGFESW
eukprot:c21633_g1_i3 orf=310-1818(-)